MNMKSISYLLSIVLAIITLSGCKTIEISLPSPNTPAIKLNHAQTVELERPVKIDFPSGIYIPEFQTAEGIYYKCPTKIIEHAPLVGSSVRRGGLFIPFENHSDQKQGLWLDHEELGGGVIVQAITLPHRIYKFKNNLEYEVSSD